MIFMNWTLRNSRVTDTATLAVTESVLCASVNKALVRAALLRKIRAVGISGEDAWLLKAEAQVGSQGQSLGFVGRIVHVSHRLLTTLLPVAVQFALSRLPRN